MNIIRRGEATRVNIIFLFSLSLILFSISDLFATDVGGAITVNTTWNTAGSPYVLKADVTVSAGVTLTIMPGVEVQTPSASYEFMVSGTIDADGVTFTNDYTELRALTGGSLNLVNCSIDSGYVTYNDGSSGTISGTIGNWELTVNSAGVSVTAGCSIKSVTASRDITVSSSTLGYITLSGGTPIITGNTFSSMAPIRISDPDIRLSGIFGNIFNSETPVVNIYGSLDNSLTLGPVDGLKKYGLTQNLFVSIGAVLTVGPEIELNNDYYSIQIYGSLIADGASFGGPEPNIVVKNGGTLNIVNSTIVAGYVTFDAGSSGTINHCTGDWRLTVNGDNVSVLNQSRLLWVVTSKPIVIADSALDYVSMVNGATALTMTGCTLTNGFPLRISDPDVDLSSVIGNTFSFNEPRIAIQGILNSSKTISPVDGLRKYEIKGGSALSVNSGAVLTINPSVEFYSEGNNNATFSISGSLMAFGVFFGGENVFMETYAGSNLILSDCRLLPTSYGSVSISGNGKIENCEIRKVKIQVFSASPEIIGCHITYPGNNPVSISDGSPRISNCEFTGSTTAIRISGNSDPYIFYNNFSGNFNSIENTGTNTINCRYNWWGDASGPTHPDNPEGTGDRILGNVLFSPWLNAPFNLIETKDFFFFEEFSDDLSSWFVRGIPLPSIVTTDGLPLPCFSTNGDDAYAGLAVTRQTFNYHEINLNVSVDMKAGSIYDYATFALTKSNVIGGTDQNPTWEPLVLVKMLSVQHPSGAGVILELYNALGTLIENSGILPVNVGTGWHNLLFRIRVSDRKVELYFDGEIAYASSQSVSLDYSGTAAVGLGNRLAWHDNVKVFSENADFDQDGDVDGTDLWLFRQHFTQAATPADLSKDNQVDDLDAKFFGANLGKPY